METFKLEKRQKEKKNPAVPIFHRHMLCMDISVSVVC